DHPLADFTREIEIDIRDRGELLVQEASDIEIVPERIDRRETDQVADDRTDRRAAATPRWQEYTRTRRLAATNLGGDSPGEIEQVAIEQEETGETMFFDQAELFL